MRLLVATHNAGKKREYVELLASLGLDLVSLADLGIRAEIAEDGDTYAANALAKARGYAALTGLPTLADDSGLEVDGLDGQPGVHSARYGGVGQTDTDRCQLLLRKLEGMPPAGRTARFRCVIAIVGLDASEHLVEGTCEGVIAAAPRGENGFGYDPLFFLPEFGCTMAELSPGVKNRISHRARAAQAARKVLQARQVR